MQCKECKSGTEVVRSMKYCRTVRRIRKCKGCGAQFVTWETVDEELFSRAAIYAPIVVVSEQGDQHILPACTSSMPTPTP